MPELFAIATVIAREAIIAMERLCGLSLPCSTLAGRFGTGEGFP